MNDSRIYYSQAAAARENRQKVTLLVFALGLGALMALLLAPKSGDETRGELSHNLERGVNRGRGLAEPALKRIEDELAELHHKVDERFSELRKA